MRNLSFYMNLHGVSRIEICALDHSDTSENTWRRIKFYDEQGTGHNIVVHGNPEVVVKESQDVAEA
jgi:hypothetical protein